MKHVRDHKLRIAVTGTIGSGKSAVCAYLREKGYDVFDCDAVNRELLEPGNDGYKAVRKVFPECFHDEELDKKALSQEVFQDPEKRLILESLLHPLILKELKEREDDPLFAEVPLLFEAGWDRYFDLKILVVSDDETVCERLRQRGLSEDEIRGRLNAQMPAAEKMKRADKIIYNNDSLSALYRVIDELLEEIL